MDAQMVSYKGQSSDYVTLWIFYLLVGVVPDVITVSDVALTSNPSTNEPICPGETIEFTCTTTGSSRLSWTSDEYIGVGSQFEFLSINSIGTTKTSSSNPDTIANLTSVDDENLMLTSTLQIVITSSSIITCINGGLGTTNISMVQVATVPNRPQMVTADGSVDDCMIQVTWDPPVNPGRSNYMYRIDVPSRNIMASTNFSTESTLHVPNCADGILIQVYAVNRFGCMSVSSETQLRLQSGSSTGELSEGAIAVLISYYEWKVKKQSDKDKFISYLALLYEVLKGNIHVHSSLQEAVRDLLNLMLEKKMSSTDIKEALKRVLETRVTSVKGIQFAVRQLKTAIPTVMSTFDAELSKVDSSITVTMNELSALKDEDDHKKSCDKLIKLVEKASPDKIKGLLLEFLKALQDYSEAENELQKAFEELGKTFLNCTMLPAKIKEILEEANRKLQDNSSDSDEPKGSTNKNDSKEDVEDDSSDSDEPKGSKKKESVEDIKDDSSDSDEPKESKKKKESMEDVEDDSSDSDEPKGSKNKNESVKDVEDDSSDSDEPKGSKKKESVEDIKDDSSDSDEPKGSKNKNESVEDVEDPSSKQPFSKTKGSKNEEVSIAIIMEESEDTSGPPSDHKQQQGSKPPRAPGGRASGGSKPPRAPGGRAFRGSKPPRAPGGRASGGSKPPRAPGGRASGVSRVPSFRERELVVSRVTSLRRGSGPFPRDDGLSSDDSTDGPLPVKRRRPSTGGGGTDVTSV